MQQRLVSLVGRVTQDDITAELLRLNDELNNAFIRSEHHCTRMARVPLLWL